MQINTKAQNKSNYRLGIIKKNLKKSNQDWPVLVVVVIMERNPWRWPLDFQKGLWGVDFAKILLSLQEDMLDFDLRLLDRHDPVTLEVLLFYNKDRKYENSNKITI